jgi:tight adherence protein B
MQMLVLILVFAGALLLIVGLYSFVNRARLAASAAARERLHGTGRRAEEINILRDQRVSSVGFLDRLLTNTSLSTMLEDELRRSGLRRSVGEFVLGSLLCGVIAFWLGTMWLPTFAPLMGIAGTVIPFLFIRSAQERRLRKVEDQLPDALDMMVNALKAGYSLQAAIEFVGREMPEPLGPEFARVYEEQRLGVEMRHALESLQVRVPSTDLKMLVTSILIQRETGGNLAEILTNIATLIRTRQTFKGHLAGLIAEPKMSSYLLTALPPAVFALLLAINREYITPLLVDPRGKLMLVYAVISLFFGFLALRKIADVEF